MKNFRRFFLATVLLSALAMPIFAGETQGPPATDPGDSHSPGAAIPGDIQGVGAADPGDGHSPGAPSPGDMDTGGLTAILLAIGAI